MRSGIASPKSNPCLLCVFALETLFPTTNQEANIE